MLKSLSISAFVVMIAMISPAAQAQSDADNLHLTEKRDLAGVLGQAHFIRTLCNGKTDQYWREFMSDFLELEGVTKNRRSLFVKAFNHGYRYQSRLPDNYCDATTPVREAALAREGRKLAETIARGYLQ